jgi:hypothetical protein
MNCDQLWDLVCQSKGQPPSDGLSLHFNNIRDWTGYIGKGDRIREPSGSGVVYKANWVNLQLAADQSPPAIAIKVPNQEFDSKVD